MKSLVITSVLSYLDKPEAFHHMAVIFFIFKTTDTVVENFIEKRKVFYGIYFFFFKQGTIIIG